MLEFGVLAGISARYICLATLWIERSQITIRMYKIMKRKSFDSEHDDAMPNHISVETNNNEHQHMTMQCQTTFALKQITMSINKHNMSTRNEINNTIECHNNKTWFSAIPHGTFFYVFHRQNPALQKATANSPRKDM